MGITKANAIATHTNNHTTFQRLTHTLDAPPRILALVLTTNARTKAITNAVLAPDDAAREGEAEAKKHKNAPLPAERVESDAEDEPPDELQIREKIKSPRGRRGFQGARHVDPAPHPGYSGPR